ncbi:MAG TPA: hypothetical protein V6D12_13675 [Candidatus Obscuribacterales bacterium]
MTNWREIFAAVAVGVAIASAGKLPLPAQSQVQEFYKPSPAPAVVAPSPSAAPMTTTAPTATSRRMKIQISVTSPDDLKVKEGNKIDAGDILADRDRERSRLTSQKQQLQLSKTRIAGAIVLKPAPPAPVPAVKELPPISYEEQKSRIDTAKLDVDRARERLDIQQRKLDAIKLIPENELPAAVLSHEEAVMRDYERKLAEAESNFSLVQSQLQSAKDSRAYDEYKASLEEARRQEEANQATLTYQRQLQESLQDERNKQFQISQIDAKLQEVDNQIAQLSTIKAPYAGTIKRIKWLGQNNNLLAVELTLIASTSTNSSTFTSANGSRVVNKSNAEAITNGNTNTETKPNAKETAPTSSGDTTDRRN